MDDNVSNSIMNMTHIEQYWSQLNSTIKKIYPIFPKNEYICYIKEGEYRIKLAKKKPLNKLTRYLNY